MQNINEVQLPEQLPGENDLDYGHRCVQAAGSAFALFTITRDYLISKANELQELTAGRNLSIEEKLAAKSLRNQIIVQQTALDAAWQFEQICSADGMVKN